ncbi:hypothetical protein Despr_1234 [Desulfobulbus propionicus DSM 2032]|uniref:DUF5666 domain-containing protein n=1 Tax=Desulfobulbus propionicus (strain ATCC 33891 / DSM 2032 / VKM B-1956 / 1pr3) TaxID=577650 RepID=A0A7U3YL59_DESPD|nr:hypothetical protein [Desulfobulbus propionicus]ADW17399.1 hypothetical protein Despr_1234 [Desulfobulbus propionicus DSM 2032]
MSKIFSMVMVVACVGILAACAKTEQPVDNQASMQEQQASNLDVQRSSVQSTVATVESVNLKTRMVKLRSLEGRPFTIHVGKEAVNLPQVKAGDRVEITYTESLEVRMAEPGEVIEESSTVVGRAVPGAKPGGFGITETNITAEILDLDKANETATLKMADGSVATVKVQNPANLEKVKVGDTIAIKYLEALEITVKGKKK